VETLIAHLRHVRTHGFHVCELVIQTNYRSNPLFAKSWFADPIIRDRPTIRITHRYEGETKHSKMSSSCTSLPRFPPAPTTIEQSTDGVKDLLQLLSVEHPLNSTEEEIDLTQLQVDDDQEEEFDLTDLHEINDGGFTDLEIEEKLEKLATNKFKATGFAAAFAASALKEKANKTTKPNHSHDPNDPPTCAIFGCKEKAYTNTHTSWCQKHEDQMIDPIRNDFLQEVSKWPDWLQDKINAFGSIKLSVDDVHHCLFEVAVPKLKDLMSRVKGISLKAKINDMLKAIATYKARFGLIPGVAFMLLTFAVTILFAFGSVLLAPIVPALTFCAAAGTALVATVVGVGVWRNRAFLVKLGYGAMIGAGVTMLTFGPAAAAAGALIGAGMTGWYLLPKEQRVEMYDEIAAKNEELKKHVRSSLGGSKK
jgi:hypothetical protein